jgi:molybdopterin-guanine dinucleotide biosynthesis protein A
MKFSAALLVGGRSLRMGRDKALLTIEGVPLWQRQLRLLRELQPSEIFFVGPAREEWIAAGCECFADAANDVGPIGGIVAALRRSAHSHLLVLAIDLPQMRTDFLRNLLALCSENHGIIPKTNEQFEPLAAIYPVSCLEVAERCLSAGEYSLQKFARRAVNAGLLVVRKITTAEESLFFNVNTPADLAAIATK